MAKVNPQEYAEKWARRLSGSTEDIRRGIAKVSTAPGELAAAQQEAMLTNVVASINSGLWARQVRGVSLADWKTAATDKGIPRIAVGVTAAQPKMERIAGPLLQAVDESAAISNALPKGTLEDSINRMTTFVREMHARAPRRQGL